MLLTVGFLLSSLLWNPQITLQHWGWGWGVRVSYHCAPRPPASPLASYLLDLKALSP